MSQGLTTIGSWVAGAETPAFGARDLLGAVERVRESVHVVQDPESSRLGVGFGGEVNGSDGTSAALPLLASLPAIYPEWLGDRGFCERHAIRFPYVAGAMANGIATAGMVKAIAEAGCLGFFGAAGLEPAEVERAIDELQDDLDDRGLPWGSNLIHSPHEPELEEAVADLYIRRGVRRVSASAYMKLTAAVVRYAASGLRQAPDGSIHRSNHVFAKISHPEVARRFMEPAPAKMLVALVDRGSLTADEARLAMLLPVAETITVEGDSGGHTDGQTLGALLPTVSRLRDEIAAQRGYRRAIHVGAAGGLGTPAAVAAAFSLGAAYVLTGSVNQSCVESGLHEDGRQLLLGVGPGDVMMAPAADMFEMGVQVQVLARGTMFAVRAKKLYELYRAHDSLETLPAADAAWLEEEIFHATLEEAWRSTRTYWQDRDAAQAKRAEEDSKARMALLFRSYLGLSSRWAIDGESERRLDYQIWCGQAMGAFNAWTEGSFLANPKQRTVTQVALNLLEGATVVSRVQQLRSYGVPVPAAAFDFRPRPLL